MLLATEQYILQPGILKGPSVANFVPYIECCICHRELSVPDETGATPLDCEPEGLGVKLEVEKCRTQRRLITQGPRPYSLAISVL